MSLKSFHIIFLIVSTLFAIYFSYWCYLEWTFNENNIYLLYSLVGVLLCIGLSFYSKWFIKEINKINVS